jgi:ADP-ribose pyrophosphatase YjhB (NUDIX family)
MSEKNTLPNKFTIRVYGLLIENEALLLSRENIKGGIYTKLPGGGLEFGEGTLDCLRREFMEEAGIKVNPYQHFYTTENYVKSGFGFQTQVLSIYYRVNTNEAHLLPLGDASNTEEPTKNGQQILYFKKLSELSAADVDLPIDKTVIKLLLKS